MSLIVTIGLASVTLRYKCEETVGAPEKLDESRLVVLRVALVE